MADDAPLSTARDYRETVFLPDTPFPMRGGLPQKEPEILARWADLDLYHSIRKARQAAGAPLYVLHDGPPYANGAIHIGHALNQILKDFIVRSRFALGYDVDYVPGWDCHGLPIEWKIEEEVRAKGLRKDEVPVAEFRARCRAFAGQWIDQQRTEFKRLGVLGRWGPPLPDHGLRLGSRHRRRVPQVPDVRPALSRLQAGDVEPGRAHRPGRRRGRVPRPRLADGVGEVPGEEHSRRQSGASTDASIVIWTTTPWTIPANRAISFNPAVEYGLYEVVAMEEGLAFEPWAKPGDRLIVADKLAADVAGAAKIAEWTRVDGVDPAWRDRSPSAGGAGRGLRVRRAAAGRRSRYRRYRHGLCAHRAGPRSGRLSGLAGPGPPATPFPTLSIRTAPTIRMCPCSAG